MKYIIIKILKNLINNKLFKCLNNKKKRLIFFKKEKEDILQPIDRTIDIKGIWDIEQCACAIIKMKDNIKYNFKIFNYIKTADEKIICQFENYSKAFSLVIKLDTNEDLNHNVYDIFIIYKSQKAFYIIMINTINRKL